MGGEGQKRSAILEKALFPFTVFFSDTPEESLKFCSCKSLAILAKFIPSYFVSLVGSVNRIFSLIIFSKCLA